MSNAKPNSIASNVDELAGDHSKRRMNFEKKKNENTRMENSISI